MGLTKKIHRAISRAKGTVNSSAEGQTTSGGLVRRFRFNNKGRLMIAVALIAVILVSSFVFFPRGEPASDTPGQTTGPTATANVTQRPTSNPANINNGPTSAPFNPFQPIIDAISGKDRSTEVVTNAQTLNSSVWRQVASYAWNYFQPGTGVDSRTGLPASGDTVSFFTDWDIGVYLQAVMDAQKVGLIGSDGPWGSSARIDKVLSFLETRDLNSTTHYPYWFYENDGTVYHDLSDKATDVCNIADTGRMFVALNNVKTFNSSFANRIDNLVYNVYGNRSDYTSLVPRIKTEGTTSSNIYAYYAFSGFASFWPNQLRDIPTKILSNIMSSPTVKTPENITLPNSRLTEDPLLCSIFELSNNPPQLTALAKQVYLAQEAYYNATKQYRAFGEGNTFTSDWAYEWIVYDGKTWAVRTGDSNLDISPIVYTKIAFSFLAVYNTTYARNLVMYIEDQMNNPSNGYDNGIDEAGTVLSTTGLHTNGLIVSAARYAIQNNP